MRTKPILVLYLVDNPDDIIFIKSLLSETPDHNLKFVYCNTLSNAYEIIAKQAPDAVLLDLNLSDSKGYDTFSSFYKQCSKLPVVVLTERSLQELGLTAVRNGAQDFLLKGQLIGPLLVRSILYAVERKSTEKRLTNTKIQLEAGVKERGQDLIRANAKLKQEIKKSKLIKQKLIESRRILRMVTDNIPARLAYVDKNLRYQYVNKAYESFFGKSVKNIVGSKLSTLYKGPNKSIVLEYVNDVLSGKDVICELEAPILVDGKAQWWETSLFPNQDSSGEVQGFCILANEITEKKNWIENNREQRLLLENILKGIGAAVFFIDTENYVITEVNDIASDLLGVEKKDLIGSNCYDYICVENKREPDMGCPIMGENTLHGEFKLTRPDGIIVPILKTVLTVTMNDRPYNVAILLDISERKAIERQLAYAQKLESIGQLAAGIAHEINTPIQYIGSNVQFFQNVYEKVIPILSTYQQLTSCISNGVDAKECNIIAGDIVDESEIDSLLEEVPLALEDALEGVKHVASIVLAMKKFSHPDFEEKKIFNVNEAISNTVTIAKNEWKYVADVEMDLAEDLPHIMAVPSDVNQVLLNILVNCSHAISEKNSFNKEDKGLITISTKNIGEMVEISMSDNGCGIPESNQKRIFDPFFTTKEVGKGTGQGLAITLAIVEKHSGVIDFESKEGEGTKFIIRLPVNGE